MDVLILGKVVLGVDITFPSTNVNNSSFHYLSPQIPRMIQTNFAFYSKPLYGKHAFAT